MRLLTAHLLFLPQPLSQIGKAQAKALGKSSFIQSTAFWRRYSSDLGRAIQTAKLMFEFDDDDDTDNPIIIADKRLREIAKGARQGFPKSWDYEQCLQERSISRSEEPIPPLETNAQAWDRLYQFLYQVLRDAVRDEAHSNDDNNLQVPKKNVLVVSHAGAMRLLLQKLVPDSHPSLKVLEKPGSVPDDTKRLQVPNTSVTILDITIDQSEYLHYMASLNDTTDAPPPVPSSRHRELFSTKVIEFLMVEHLKGLYTANDE
jgi:broad specificity phosphatase PhoE